MTITAAELKRRVEHAGAESHFFARRTMKFFGDTMRNYGARGPLQIQTYEGPAKVCVWVGIGMGAYRVGCQRSTLRISSGAYCPDCGGKIKVAR